MPLSRLKWHQESNALVPGESSPTRVAAQVVSGIGFLGAGLIFREGASVRGLNTAATVWCSAAIGVLAGVGYLTYAAVQSAGDSCRAILRWGPRRGPRSLPKLL